MNKSQQHMEQMAALVLLAFTIGLLLGEALCGELFGGPDRTPADLSIAQPPTKHAASPAQRKWQRYSGVFILLKRKLTLSTNPLRAIQAQVVTTFAQLVQPSPVRT